MLDKRDDDIVSLADGSAERPSPAGGPDLAQGKPMSASGSHYDGSNGPELANDGSLDTWWASGWEIVGWETRKRLFPQWIQVDLGSRRTVCRLVLKLREIWPARNQTLSVEGSADGSTFTTLVTSASYRFANTATIEVPPTLTRYVRLVFTANDGPLQPGAQLGAFEVYGLAAGEASRAGKTYVRLGKQRSFVGTVNLGFEGDLRWDGDGGYTITGRVKASGTSDARRSTVWLEYGGESQSWTRSSETETSYGKSGTREIEVSGQLAPGEKLELRVGTWQAGVMGIGSTEHTDKKQYTIS
ncbi:hypothetical protein Sviol_60610 [Streptomyces violascens]|uniref:F5/8 type C domain-containing protein n=1 Tax=Streptomyces violascens TaxID=67381 RepID=A0ABQ3QWM3_9ACTN|nr:hypothetical protein Sviol_60610 [Streptomyces violascens]